jgi:hypothetical protein
MDIDSPAQTVTCRGRVCRPPSEWWVALTTNTDTTMPTFNNLVMDPDEEVLTTSRNRLDYEIPKFYRQGSADLMLIYGILLSRLKWMLFRVTILGIWLIDLLTERL